MKIPYIKKRFPFFNSSMICFWEKREVTDALISIIHMYSDRSYYTISLFNHNDILFNRQFVTHTLPANATSYNSTWTHHCVYSQYLGVNDNCEIGRYLNGTQEFTRTINRRVFRDFEENIYRVALGNVFDSSENITNQTSSFSGSLKALNMYKRKLSPKEIQQLYRMENNVALEDRVLSLDEFFE